MLSGHDKMTMHNKCITKAQYLGKANAARTTYSIPPKNCDLEHKIPLPQKQLKHLAQKLIWHRN